MNISKKVFGEHEGQTVDEYTLTNDNGISISVLTFAGLWRSYTDGKTNLLLSADDLENYTNNPFFAGRIIGRIGGRLKDGQFSLNGKDYQVDQNEGNNNLHGGANGFANQVWDAETSEDANGVSLKLSKTFTTAMDQFPGKMPTTVTYTLANDNSVTIDFTATSDEDTLFNPTSHAYWNLGDADTTDILAHTFQANADSHLEFDSEKIATGNLLDNAGTPFDFSQPTVFKDAIDGMQNTTEKGFDDILVVKPSADTPVATLHDPASGHSLKVYSQRNGLVVFTANSFDDSMTYNRGVGHPWEAVALEAQTLSDTPHHPNFGDVTLPAGETKSYQIKFEGQF